MARTSLLEYFREDSRPAGEIAVTWRRGYRTARCRYSELFSRAANFSRELETRGIAPGDRVLLWGENTGEWVAAFLGCMFRGVIVVPMDVIADPDFARRVAQQSGVRLAVADRRLARIPLGPAIPAICLEDLGEAAKPSSAAPFQPIAAKREDVVEIVFTSGTTAEPRGVVLTHGNLLSSLEPIEKGFLRYRRYERIFHPLRFLDLLPLSHVFGQLLGIFLPQVLEATAVFTDTFNPAEVAETIHKERVSVLVTVPRLIESLRAQIERDMAARGEFEQFQRAFARAEHSRFLLRWWIFRKIHRRFGWKFWAIISGGAALPAAAENFWSRLGYAVIQGYGLTETTSLVSLNHPLRPGHGSIGKALPGLEVKLSVEGEILVRGENVAAGYWKESRVAPVLDEEGWFHTGDLGERDAQGNFYFKGRQKNVIVTPAGLNIYPQDLEAELRKEPGVRDCVVLGLDRDGNSEPCAVLLLQHGPSAGADDPAGILARANARLADFQQIRRWLVWPGQDFPRTPTQKPVLSQIRLWAEAESTGAQAPAHPASSPFDDLIARIAPHAAENAGASEALHLTSIERVELLSALEARYQRDLSETEFTQAQTVSALKRLLDAPAARSAAMHFPRWAQSLPVRWIRAAAFYLLVRPAMLILAWPRIRGRENLAAVQSPVLIVANHVTYLDPGYILAALPARLRHRLGVAMGGERLEGLREPPRGTPFFTALVYRFGYWLAVALFNVFPLPQETGFRKSFSFAGELAGRGWSVLIFPEGLRTRDGRMAPFRAGIGLLAAQLRIPVVPVRVDGLYELKMAGKRWARPGTVRVTIGAPVKFSEEAKPEEIARELEVRVANL
ncbi:MAG: AMP-binding protein [Candidatus Acidiferrales bacterium]